MVDAPPDRTGIFFGNLPILIGLVAVAVQCAETFGGDLYLEERLHGPMRAGWEEDEEPVTS